MTGASLTAKAKLARSRAGSIVIEAQKVGLNHLCSVYIALNRVKMPVHLLYGHDEDAFFLVVGQTSFFSDIFEPLSAFVFQIGVVDLIA